MHTEGVVDENYLNNAQSLEKVFFYKTKRFKNTKRFGCVKRHGKNGNDVRIETYAKVKSEVFAQLETNFLCILKRENKTNITLNIFCLKLK